MGTRIWRWLAPVLVLALAAGAGFALLIGKGVHDTAQRRDAAPETVPAPAGCQVVQLAFDEDEQMSFAAQALARDPQVYRLFPETKAQAYARFRQVFKDDPKILNSVSPESIPALLSVVPNHGADPKALAAKWGQRYTTAQNAQVLPAAGLPAAWRPAGC